MIDYRDRQSCTLLDLTFYYLRHQLDLDQQLDDASFERSLQENLSIQTLRRWGVQRAIAILRDEAASVQRHNRIIE